MGDATNSSFWQGPDFAYCICQLLPPYHRVATLSKTFRDAHLAKANHLVARLTAFECRIPPSFAPVIYSKEQFLAFALRRSSVEEAASLVCPHEACGAYSCRRCETLFPPGSCLEDWCPDLDFTELLPRGFRQFVPQLQTVLSEIGRGLPVLVVEHVHFNTATEMRDTHIFWPIGCRALELAYTVEYSV